jgi:LacI family transcriptional regulator
MAVTLREVAARAGVSPVVVSRVLHNKALAIRVTEATADRVRKAAEELGYRRNVTAINFRARQTLTIGVLHGAGRVMPRLAGGTGYFSALMDGIIAGAFEHGYSVTLCPKLLGQTPEDGMSDGRFDGLLLYSPEVTEINSAMLRACTLPLVLVHSRASEFGCDVPSVMCDNDQGIALAVEHLVKLGHRRITFAVEAWPDNTELAERKRWFGVHCDRLGLSSNEYRIVHGHDHDAVFANGTTAVMTNHDDLAAYIYQAARSRGLRVPEDVSVVGFDSTSFCLNLRPSLTSVHQPLQEMGRAACDLLVSAIRGETTDPPELLFPCGFDIRESTTLAPS